MLGGQLLELHAADLRYHVLAADPGVVIAGLFRDRIPQGSLDPLFEILADGETVDIRRVTLLAISHRLPEPANRLGLALAVETAWLLAERHRLRWLAGLPQPVRALAHGTFTPGPPPVRHHHSSSTFPRSSYYRCC